MKVQSDNRSNGRTTARRSKAGFTLLELCLLGGLTSFIAAVSIPGFVQTRAAGQVNSCISNLQQIDAAQRQWALEQRQGRGAAVRHAELAKYLHSEVKCPSGGKSFADSYRVSVVSARPSCLRSPATHALHGDDMARYAQVATALPMR